MNIIKKGFTTFDDVFLTLRDFLHADDNNDIAGHDIYYGNGQQQINEQNVAASNALQDMQADLPSLLS